ncbi:MAG: hypothetical protein IJ868_06395 [Prevotella sp.]|nr:hypothetical protein [Prevotella sp.]
MKRTAFFLVCLLTALCGQAQNITAQLTEFHDFRPAIVYTADGKRVKVPLANIFLKNSSLLFVNDKGTAMEVNTKTLLRVDFDSCSYYRIDSLLATPVDTVGNYVLYKAKVIDIKAYQQILKNNKNITNLDLTSMQDMISYSTVELSEQEAFPLIPIFYIRMGDKFVLAHERHLKLNLDKEHRRRMEGLLSQPGFSWTDEKSLVQLMNLIQ